MPAELRLQQNVYAEQVKMLYASMPASVIANVITSMLLVAAEWQSIEKQVLLGWFIISVFIILLRALLHFRYSHASHELDDMPRWGIYFNLGSTSTGFMLGMAGIFLFPAEQPLYQLLCAFVLVGMASGAVSSLSFGKFTYPLYISSVYLPLIYSLAITSSDLTLILIPMIMLSFAFSLRSARYIYKNSKQNIELRIRATEREKELAGARQRQELHTKNTPLGVIEWDHDFRVTEWNPSAEKIFGYRREEAVGKHASELILTNELVKHVEDIWQQLMQASGGYQSTNENITKDGRLITCEWYNTPLISDDGQTIGVTSLVQDVTERQRIDKLKSEFISTVSHELRTPLTAIRGSLGLISGMSSNELPEQVSSMLTIASNNTERLLLLVNDLLDMQKLESGNIQLNFTECNLTELVKQLIDDSHTYASQFHVDIQLNSSDPDLCLMVDELRFNQAMSNLLSNAVKFSPEHAQVEVNILPADDQVKIEVVDQGNGIPVEFRDKIFERFSQSDSSDSRKVGGTGLGLAISKAIIEQHGGTIGFRSETGKGTTFYITLPVSN